MRFSDTCLSLSKAFCCCPVGLMISSMRCTGSLVKLAAWSPQSEANVVASEELVPAVPRPYSVYFAPSASKRCLWSSFSESYKCGSAGRTISMACIVARGAFQWRLAARALLDKISMRRFGLYAAVTLCVCGLSATAAAERFGQWSLEQPEDFIFALSFKRWWSQGIDATLYLGRPRWSGCDGAGICSRF
jgi:hypothetical protein